MKKGISFLFLVAALLCCNDRLDWVPSPAPEVSGLSPSSGSVGTEVVIKGTFFSKDLQYNIVKFNGVAATIIKSSNKRLEVVAPLSTTGPVTVTVNGHTADNQPIFEYE